MKETNYLKDDLKNIEMLMKIPALRDFHTRDLRALLKICKIRRYDDGESIIDEGEKDPWLYFLLQGKIRIEKENIPICTIGAVGEIFGEMRIIDRMNRSASVYAVGDTVCLAVDTSARHRFHVEKDLMRIMSILQQIISRSLSIRLRFLNEQLIKAKAELINLKNFKLSA
jgi:CRP/FNR family transcriptional regulator, cyclic AMP receptor protein